MLATRRAMSCASRPRFDQRLKQLWIAPPNGLYGIENERGFVSADETGGLYGSAMIFLFVLAVGAFITVTMKTGAIQTGIGRLALRFRHSGSVLIAILMGVFALGGTSYGMWEETLGFFVLLVPLTLALGYDRMVAASIIFLGAGTGVLCSTVNPFATGVASDAAGISLGEGIGLRIAMWVVLVAMAIGYVSGTRAASAATRAARSSASRRTDAEDASGLIDDVPALTGRQKLVLVLFAGVVPGHDLRLHPLERPLAGGLGTRLPAADVRVVLLPRGGGAVLRHGGRDRPDRQARRGGHGQHDHRRRRPTSSPRR